MCILKTGIAQPPPNEAWKRKDWQTYSGSNRLSLQKQNAAAQLPSTPRRRQRILCMALLHFPQPRSAVEALPPFHSPGRPAFECFSFSSACGRCPTLATHISCPGTHQVQDVKQRRRQQPLCLKPSKDRDTIPPADRLKEGYDLLSDTNAGHCWKGERLCISLATPMTIKTFQTWITEPAF